MSRTTVMDADIGEAEVTVKIQRHTSDMHTLAEDVGQRAVTTLKQHPTGCFFFNPATTVSCPQPTEEFFRVIRKEQARWCRQAGNSFPRKLRRSSSHWVSGGEWISNKFARYLDRSCCFTGVLFIDGQLVLPHDWPINEKTRPHRRDFSHHEMEATNIKTLRPNHDHN